MTIEQFELPVTPIAEITARGRACVAGRLSSLTYSPADAHPEFTVRISDETGTIGLLFVGREDIAGLEVGRGIIAAGTVTEHLGRLVIFNPIYELREA